MGRGLIVVFILSLTLYSCESKKKEIIVEHSEWSMRHDDYDYLMECLYVDKYKCIHTTRECDVLDSLYRVEIIDTAYLKRVHYDWYCSECVNIQRYKHIESIVVRNELKKGFSYKDILLSDDVIDYEPE